MNLAVALTVFATLSVYILRRVAPKLPKVYLPFISIAIAVLSNIAIPEGSVSMDDIMRGVMEGLAASGLWSAGAKHLLPMKEES